MIKFLDIHKINNRFQTQFKEQFDAFLESGYYILGNQVCLFESQFADYCGVKHCIGVGNGLDALRLVLEGYKVLGKLKEGDEVIVAANTFIATIIAIKQARLKPVLIDCEREHFNFDISALKSAITDKTKAIMPVHLYGELAPMQKIKTLLQGSDILIIEDAAQAHGAKNVSGKRAGNLGDAAGFSFYPTKNLGALGDAGAVTTNDDNLAATIRKLRNYGTSSKYVNELLGFNSRLDEIQASFLHIKLPFLNRDNEARRAIARRYCKEIKNSKIKLPPYFDGDHHVFHLFVIQVENRMEFQEYLSSHKIGTLIHYPIAPHQQDALIDLKLLKFPKSETLHKTVISLPISPVMEQQEVSKIIEVINNYS